MSTNQDIKQLKSSDISLYLQDNPDFFQDKDHLVEKLQLTHTAGNAISLIERQVDILRQQNVQLNKQLNELFSIAKENDHATQKMHNLILALLSCQRLHDIATLLETRLVEDFTVDSALLKLFSVENAVLDAKNTISMDESSVQAKTIKKLINKREPICGFFNQLNSKELQTDKQFDIKSMAVMPLFVDKNDCFGVLILGSEDKQHFNPDNGIVFLKNLAEIVSATLVKYL
ncbi:MAG: DUF484 family protein [Pseudomonadota bacterium]